MERIYNRADRVEDLIESINKGEEPYISFGLLAVGLELLWPLRFLGPL